MDLGDAVGLAASGFDLRLPSVWLARLVWKVAAVAPLVMPYAAALPAVVGVGCPASGPSEEPGNGEFFLSASDKSLAA